MEEQEDEVVVALALHLHLLLYRLQLSRLKCTSLFLRAQWVMPEQGTCRFQVPPTSQQQQQHQQQLPPRPVHLQCLNCLKYLSSDMAPMTPRMIDSSSAHASRLRCALWFMPC